MIELRDVRFSYAERCILDGVDLHVEEGELVVVSGPTGAGKSTLLGVITGLVPRFTGGHLSGEVRLDGTDVRDRPPRERAHLVGYVGQDPAAGFVTDSVEEELAYGMEQLGLPGDTMRRRVEETLDLLGIADLRHRDLRTLSGGQQQRVAMGSVLTMHPKVLVLDEPTSALDPTAAEEVLASITRLVHDLGLSVVLAEHRLERVIPFADRMALLGTEGTLSVGEPKKILAESPVVPPIIELGRHLNWAPLPMSVREARRLARGWKAAGWQRADPIVASAQTEPALRTERLVVTHGSTVAVREVDLTLHPGSITALMGRNGSGKSSLLWAIQGSGARRSGHVRVDGVDPAEATPAQRRDLVGLVPQVAADLLYLETVAAECAAADAGALAPAGTCRGILDRLVSGVDPTAHPRDLSEGQRLALALAVVLSSAPRVLLLDEPTRGLDYSGKRGLGDMLRQIALEDRAVLVATHDVEFAAAVATDAIVLAEGEVVSSGAARRVLTESPSFAPQITKILGAPWLHLDDVVDAVPGPTT